MTEADWQHGTRPTTMLLAVRDRVSRRKVLLFGCACCRVWARLGPADRDAVRQVEAAIDDASTVRDFLTRLEPEQAASLAAAGLSDGPVDDALASLLATQTALRLRLDGHLGWGIGSLAFEAVKLAATDEPADGRQAAQTREEAGQADLAREVFGNPLCPAVFLPDWRTATAVSLARQMYDGGDFSAMPILADALQDAGCDIGYVLSHCRGEGLHVRGCWVVDLVLGKE